MATYTWNGGSGAWDDGANWSSSGATGMAPGPSDDALILAGPGVDVLSGPAAAALLTISQIGPFTVAFSGSADIGAIPTFNGHFSVLVLAGATLSVGSIEPDEGIVQASGEGALLSVASSFDSSLVAANGGAIRIGPSPSSGATESGALYADPTASIEFGGGTAAQPGQIVVDAGDTVDGSFLAFASATVIDGVVRGSGPLSFGAALSGTGTVDIATTLDLAVSAAAGLTIAFTGFDQTMNITPDGGSDIGAAITGFQAGDTIESSVAFDAFTYTANGQGGGALALIAHGATIETLHLVGSFTAADFVIASNFSTTDVPVPSGTDLVFATNPATTPAAAPGPSGSTNAYSWDVTNGGGAWDIAANWRQAKPPGSGDAVYITNYTRRGLPVIDGNGTAATLQAGAVALNGTFTATTMSIEADLLPNSSLIATTMSAGNIYVGFGDSISVAGTLDLGGVLDVVAGGRVTSGALTSATAIVLIDAMSEVEIGSGGGAQAGALNVDAGTTVTCDRITLGAALINASSIAVSFGTIDGDVSGGGTIAFFALALEGSVAASQTLAFTGSGATLDIHAAGVVAGPITGIAVGDSFVVSPDVTAASFTPNAGTRGVLRLLNASDQVVRTLDVSTATGSSGVVSFIVVPEYIGGGGNLIQTAVVAFAGTIESGPPPGPAPGTATGQTFHWTALGGDWGTAANWGTMVAPGHLDTVTLNPPGDVDVVLTGAGDAASVLENGLDALSGVFSFGTLLVEANYTYDALDNIGIDVTAGSTLTCGEVDLATGSLTAVGAGASIDIAGTLTLGEFVPGDFTVPPALVSALGGARIVVAGDAVTATDADNTEIVAAIAIDASSVIEIGTAGGAAAGALTVDAGHTLDTTSTTIIGDVVNNGVILGNVVDGSVGGSGTLETVTRVSGTIAASEHLLFRDGETIEFGGAVAATLSGFDASDEIIVDAILTGATYASTGAGTGTLTLTDDGRTVETLMLAGTYDPSAFVVTAQPAALFALSAPEATTDKSFIQLDAAAACYAAGTRIVTDRGPVSIERLAVGDRVVSAFGGSAPIVWLGQRRVACGRHPRPWDVMPVRVMANAFGPGMPARDVLLSPDHAVYVSGSLVPIRYLLNGVTVLQERAETVTWWHLELPQHDVVYAEGLPAESYLDTGNRSAFVGNGPCVQLHPAFARDVWATGGCADLLTSGPALDVVRAVLIEAARALGHVTTRDPGLVIEVDGHPLATAVLPPGARRAVVRSRSVVPAWFDGDDTRPLGVAVSSVRLDGVAVSLLDPRLDGGWHALEADGARQWRWTDGAGVIEVTGTRTIAIERVMDRLYWSDAFDQVRPARRFRA